MKISTFQALVKESSFWFFFVFVFSRYDLHSTRRAEIKRITSCAVLRSRLGQSWSCT